MYKYSRTTVGGRHGRYHMVVGFTTTYAISAILLKVAFNTIRQTNKHTSIPFIENKS